jgi:hypothetical protein
MRKIHSYYLSYSKVVSGQIVYGEVIHRHEEHHDFWKLMLEKAGFTVGEDLVEESDYTAYTFHNSNKGDILYKLLCY